MAGLYGDVPGNRLAYDVDGTLIRNKRADGTSVVVPTPHVINDEDTGDYYGWVVNGTGTDMDTALGLGNGNYSVGPSYLTFVFPQVRDIVGYFACVAINAASGTYRSAELETSTDTIDGSDGVWTQRQVNWAYSATPSLLVRQRDTITPLSGSTGIKGIRFCVRKDVTSYNGNDWLRLYCLHLYGTVVGSNNGLRFWAPTSDQEMDKAHLDFGDMPQGTAVAKQFRLKNTSTQQANAIVLSAESQTGSDAGLATGMSFSQDGSAFASTQTITSLAAGAISPILYGRRTVGAAEAAVVRAARIKAIVGSWT